MPDTLWDEAAEFVKDRAQRIYEFSALVEMALSSTEQHGASLLVLTFGFARRFPNWLLQSSDIIEHPSLYGNMNGAICWERMRSMVSDGTPLLLVRSHRRLAGAVAVNYNLGSRRFPTHPTDFPCTCAFR